MIIFKLKPLSIISGFHNCNKFLIWYKLNLEINYILNLNEELKDLFNLFSFEVIA